MTQHGQPLPRWARPRPGPWGPLSRGPIPEPPTHRLGAGLGAGPHRISMAPPHAHSAPAPCPLVTSLGLAMVLPPPIAKPLGPITCAAPTGGALLPFSPPLPRDPRGRDRWMKPGPWLGCGRRWGGSEGPGVWNPPSAQFTHRGRWQDSWVGSKQKLVRCQPFWGWQGLRRRRAEEEEARERVSMPQVWARSGHFTAMTEHLLCWFSGGEPTAHLGCRAYRILVSRPGTETGPNAVSAES